MSDLPTCFPPEITVGESIEFEKDFDDYPADEWTVTYYLRGVGPGLDIEGTADGTTHVFSVDAADTEDLVAGRYQCQAVAVKDSTKQVVDSGTVTVIASLAAVDAEDPYDGRSRAKKILDAIDAIVEGKATVDQQQYTIGTAGSTRTLIRIPIPELLQLRQYYAAKVARENRKGQGFRTIFAQFD